MTKKFIKILFGVVLVPFCFGFTWQFAATVVTVTYKPDSPYYFIAGVLLYLIIHLLFKKPILTYVVGHELTHALFVLLFGGSVRSIKASDRGGRVTISKSNFIITLAPYFFPLYTFAALAFYGIARITDARESVTSALIFLSGVTFAFHLVLTLIFLRTDQADIKEHGELFSYPLIYIFNIMFAAFLFHTLLAANMDYLMFLAGGIIKTFNMGTFVLNKVLSIAHAV